MLLSQEDEKLTKLTARPDKKPWKDWWKEKRQHNYDLLTAAEKGDTKIVLELIDQSKLGDLVADINAKALDDFTPLHNASSEGRDEIVEILIKSGANIDSLSSALRTPLHISCIRGHQHIIELLVNAGANIDAKDKDGSTPTHMLSEGGRLDIIEWFLKKKPDLEAKNIYGETAVEVAANLSIRQLLQQYSNQNKVKDTYTRTVVENVIFHNNRADFVKSMMFRAQLMSGTNQLSEQRQPVQTPVTTSEANKFKSRRVKIIEATKRISAINQEELKKTLTKKVENSQVLKEEEELEANIGPEYFDTIQLLGKGSFGEVYLVSYKPTGKVYAMKVMSKKKILGQNLVKYAKAERNVLSYTKHPFIVGLEFAFQTADKLFLILEYCPG